MTLTNSAPSSNPTYTETLSSNGFSSTTSGFTYAGSVSGIAGGASSAGTLVVGLGTTGLTAGPVSGTTTLALNSNAVNGSGLGATALTPDVVTITGTEYNLAAAANTSAVTVSSHLGVAASAPLTLTNTAPVNATYTETLSSGAFTGTTTNFTAAGSVSESQAAPTAGTLAVGVGTGLAEGQTIGTTTLALSSNAVNGSVLGITALTPGHSDCHRKDLRSGSGRHDLKRHRQYPLRRGQDCSIEPHQYRSHERDLHRDPQQQWVLLPLLRLHLCRIGIGNRRRGQHAGTLAVGVDTTLAAGQTIGTTTLALNSNAVNGSGLGITALTPDVVTITANVYNLAAAANTSTVNIGDAHVGIAATAPLTLTNSAPSSNPTYTETLSSNGFSSTTSGFTYAGSVSGIAGGASSAGTLVVGLGTTGLTAGPVSGTTTLALNSNAVNGSGLGATALTPDVVTITGTEYNLAAANTIGTVTLSTHLGVTAMQPLTLSNTAPTNATYTETLTSTGFGTPTTNFTATGSITTPLIAGGAGDSSDLVVGLGTGLAEGQTTGTVALNLASNAVNGSTLGVTALSPQTVNLVAKVYDLAAAATYVERHRFRPPWRGRQRSTVPHQYGTSECHLYRDSEQRQLQRDHQSLLRRWVGLWNCRRRQQCRNASHQRRRYTARRTDHRLHHPGAEL